MSVTILINLLKVQGTAVNVSTPRLLDSAIPALAFEFSFLTHIILSICATSFRIRLVHGRSRYATLSHVFMGRAINGQMASVAGGIDRGNFEAVYTTSIFIAANTVSQHQFLPVKGQTTSDLGKCVVEWLRAFRNVRSVVAASRREFAQSSLAASFPRGGWQNLSVPDINPKSSQVVFGFLLDELTAGAAQDERCSVYHHVVVGLSSIYEQPSREAFMRFLVEARPDFLLYVEAGEPLALMLMGVCFGLTRLLPPADMMDKGAERDLEAISLHLPPYHSLLLERAIGIIRIHPGYHESTEIPNFEAKQISDKPQPTSSA
ncbi:unnamed protein product [Clonostachys rosea]|uniref:Uncharacterized protein n=1 Tax=Bionectria ochroleuca TaxID=29856 RepID=A0ABY6USM7_BIOOC|nr:unnamed protein product [Clonostachys rosea]